MLSVGRSWVSRETPGSVVGLADVVAIAAGWHHSLALRRDGTVWAWGEGWWGRLGNGAQGNQCRPILVAGQTTVSSIAVGQGHSLAVWADGTVWAWGYNCQGQLGDGTITDRWTPTPVNLDTGAHLSDVRAVAGGYYFTLALQSAQIELTLDGIYAGTARQAEFRPGDTVRVVLKAENRGGARDVTVVCNLRDHAAPSVDYICYDSHERGMDVTKHVGAGQVEFFSFDYVLPNWAPAGSYDVIGSARDGADWNIVLALQR